MNDTEPLHELQSRLAFQEQALTELNEVVTRQAGQIGRLEQQLDALAGRYRDLRESLERADGGPPDPGEERPPHY